ncbi:MAG: hypothetical protein WDN09_03770 [bacterium]
MKRLKKDKLDFFKTGYEAVPLHFTKTVKVDCDENAVQPIPTPVPTPVPYYGSDWFWDIMKLLAIAAAVLFLVWLYKKVQPNSKTDATSSTTSVTESASTNQAKETPANAGLKEKLKEAMSSGDSTTTKSQTSETNETVSKDDWAGAVTLLAQMQKSPNGIKVEFGGFKAEIPAQSINIYQKAGRNIGDIKIEITKEEKSVSVGTSGTYKEEIS